MKRNVLYILLLIMLSVAIGHAGHFHLGPRGVHLWRQCNSLALASNFDQEGMNILHPRVDHRRGTDGITGTPFPAYEYLTALTYRAFGKHFINHRLLQYIILCLGIWGIFLVIMKLFQSEWAALLAAFFYAWSPELYYHGFNALPDVMAMSCAVWASYFYLRNASLWDLIPVVLLITLAGLIKLQYLFFGLVFITDSLFSRKFDRTIPLVILGLFSVGAVSNWYIYSIHLRHTHQLQDFGLFVNSTENWHEFKQILFNNLFIDIPEQLWGYALTLLAIIGLILLFKKQSKLNLLKYGLFALPFVLFHLKELKQMQYHAYYMMPYILMGIFLAAFTVVHMPARYRWMLLLLIPFQLFHSLNKINHRYRDSESGLPAEFLNAEQLNALKTLAGGSHQTVVGPDPSGCIYFYYLECKGWNIAGPDQLETKTEVKAALTAGKIDRLIVRELKEEYLQEYSPYFKKKTRIGEFTVLSR